MGAYEFWIAAVSIIASFGTVFGLLYFYLYTRNKQRIAMIEKGADPAILYRKPSSNRFSALKWGLLLIGLGLGFGIGGIIDSRIEADGPIPYFSMILLFGGLGLFAYYSITKGKDAAEGYR